MQQQRRGKKQRPAKTEQAPWGEPKEPAGKLNPRRLATVAFSPRNTYQKHAKAMLAVWQFEELSFTPAGTSGWEANCRCRWPSHLPLPSMASPRSSS